MELSKSLLSISLTILLIAACSSVQVTEESVTESSIATVEVSSSETYLTKTTAISTSATIYFDFDKSNLTSRSIQTLRGVISSMKDNSSLTLVLEGHADERGTREYNLALGERRANAAKDYLMTYGISGKRISVISYGKEKPVNPL